MGQTGSSCLQHMRKEYEAKEMNHLYLKLRLGTAICDSQSSDLLFVFLVHFRSYISRSFSQKQSFSGMEESLVSLNCNFQMLHLKMYPLSVY